MNDMAWHTEDVPPLLEAPPKYQLYYEGIEPCSYKLSVDGNEPKGITTKELTWWGPFYQWHLDHDCSPPEYMTQKVFVELTRGLFATKIKLPDPLPFRLTDAARLEDLTLYFDYFIPKDVRTRGQEYLDGKWGDDVRVKMDVRRVYFKWPHMKRRLQLAVNARENELEALKEFITNKGGYQGEKGGRDWFRYRYYLPLDLFDQATLERWFDEQMEKRA
jgi:hypothetical protein